MRETLIGSMTFTSPINKENSFTQWNVLEKTESKMDLYLDTDNTGYIEWDIPAMEETVSIGLVFEIKPDGKRALVDYDGIFDLPEQAMTLLERHLIDVKDMRASLAD